MSDFKNKSMTTKGLELLSKAMSGGKIEFTRIEMGSGIFSGDVSSVEGLVEVKQNLQLTNIVRKGGQVTLSAILKIEDIVTEYDWTEIGVYAKGADDVEVLYMYGYTTNSSFISKDSLNEKLINVTVIVSNVAEVTAVIDSSVVYLTREALEDHNTSNTAHNDIRELIKQLEVEIENIDVSEDIEAHNVDPTAHEDIRNMVKNIDLSVVNNHTTAVGDAINRHTTFVTDGVNNHVTAKVDLSTAEVVRQGDTTRTTLTSHVSNERVNIVNAINSARDNVNATVVAKAATGYLIPSTAWKATSSPVTTSVTDGNATYIKVFNFYVPKSGMVRLDFTATKLANSTVTTSTYQSLYYQVSSLGDGHIVSNNYWVPLGYSDIDFANMANGTYMLNSKKPSSVAASMPTITTDRHDIGAVALGASSTFSIYSSLQAGLYIVWVQHIAPNGQSHANVSVNIGYTEVN